MNNDSNTPQPAIEVPLEALSEEALRGVIESFILREGTDYGREEAHFETKYQQILKQLRNGTVKIVFDPNTESISILTAQEFKKL